MRLRSLLASLALPFIAACGGSGSNITAVEKIELSATEKQVLAGDWPINGAYAYLPIQDQVVWAAIWSHRLANIDCSLSFNAPACGQIDAPDIDFSQYTLIGIYLGRIGYFTGLPHSLGVTQVDDTLFIDYAPTEQSAQARPADSPPESVFFLVRREGARFHPITFRMAGET